MATLVVGASVLPGVRATAESSSHARTASPCTSFPSHVASRASRPSRPSVSATFARLPPGCSATLPSARCTTSTSASPTTRTCRLSAVVSRGAASVSGVVCIA
ncbi:Uncharacterised protein [Mycobacteroides abscessus]|nr:Uncharacterised protein [Mycobacteroides abscessus]